VGKQKEAERDTCFVELGRYLCEVRRVSYWRLENLKSFDEFLARRFPESRRKAYYLMVNPRAPAAAGETRAKRGGMDEGLDWPRSPRRDGSTSMCNLVAQSREMPKEDFRREVEKELTGKEEGLRS